MRGTPVAPAASMRRSRSTWVRVLQLSELDDDAGPGAGRLEDLILDVRVHARSRFRSLARPARFALYSVHTAEGAPGLPLGPGEHTLVAWHERIGERRDRVTIRAGALTQVTFTLPVLEPGQ